MAGTARLSLPFINVGQSQKEFTHNAALQILDSLVAGAIEEPPRATPPDAPALRASYIVAPGATNAWAGMSLSLASWTSGGWQFITPVEGTIMYERTGGTFAVFREGTWELGMVRGATLLIDGQQVVGSRAGAIESPAGGAVIDAEGRSAIDAILAALRQHGLIAT